MPEWVLRISMGLSRIYSTPIPFWLDLPLPELVEYVKLHNEMMEERQRQS